MGSFSSDDQRPAERTPAGCSVPSIRPFEQIQRINPKRAGDPLNDAKRGVSLPPLDLADIRVGQADVVGQSLQGQSFVQANSPHIEAKCLHQTHRCSRKEMFTSGQSL